MKKLREILFRLRALFRRERLDAEMRAEMEHHLAMSAAERVDGGMPADDARCAAKRAFGGVEQIKERARDERARGFVGLEQFLQDVRHGCRQLRRAPGFAVTATLTIALGIGAVTTILSVINGLLLRGPPLPGLHELSWISLRDPAWEAERTQSLTGADFVAWQQRQQSCVGLAALDTFRWLNITIEETPLPLNGAYVTPNFFSVLGIAPILGRDFLPDDEHSASGPAALISYDLWKKHFAAAPDVVGRTFRVDGRVTTVVGVMPPRFAFPRNEEIWLTFVPALGFAEQGRSVGVVARRKPGVSPDQAAAELAGIASRRAQEFPATNAGLTSVRLDPLLHSLVAESSGKLFAMLAAAAAVLAIACVNVMNLQFARAASRVRELALRGALGATRARIVRQVLTEGMLLVAAGATIGTALAQVATDQFRTRMAQLPFGGMPGWADMSLDVTVLGATIAAAAVAILGSSLAPAIFSSRIDAMEVLKAGAHGQSNHVVTRVGRVLVIAQIGLGCALLIAALLQVKSITKHAGMDIGFDPHGIASGRLSLAAGYPSADERRKFYRGLLDDLRSRPEFTHAALTSRSLLVMGGWPARVLKDGDAAARDEQGEPTILEHISDGYFDALGLRPRAGREFEPAERTRGYSAALVNESFAKKHFGYENPLGRRIRVLSRGLDEWRTIVGVVPDTNLQGPFIGEYSDGAGVFLPIEEAAPAFPTVVIRGRAPGAALAESLRGGIAKHDSNLSLYGVSTPRERLRAVNGEARAIAGLFVAFGMVAGVLAFIGLYGVVAFSVNARTREFGIRIALGADAPRITRFVLREGARQFVLGSLGGLALALALARVGEARLENFLYQVSPRDPAIYGTVLLLFAGVAALACWLPACRATKVDAVVALRSE